MTSFEKYKLDDLIKSINNLNDEDYKYVMKGILAKKPFLITYKHRQGLHEPWQHEPGESFVSEKEAQSYIGCETVQMESVDIIYDYVKVKDD